MGWGEHLCKVYNLDVKTPLFHNRCIIPPRNLKSRSFNQLYTVDYDCPWLDIWSVICSFGLQLNGGLSVHPCPMRRCSRKLGRGKASSGYDIILLRMGRGMFCLDPDNKKPGVMCRYCKMINFDSKIRKILFYFIFIFPLSPSSIHNLKPILDPIRFTISQVCWFMSILMAPNLGPTSFFSLGGESGLLGRSLQPW